ncbi:hypothetical protein [Streptomyces gobitricini]|uniref:Prephenate dehydrogenase n=1 Tax=Streptomyces gobitricini TaxID=68211 RepID=A0ABP5ZBX6_9ACTN
MPISATAAGNIEATTALLREELPQLEQQQQALEKDLAAVTDRLGSVRSALTALEALSIGAVPAPRTEAPEEAEDAPPAATPDPTPTPTPQEAPAAEAPSAQAPEQVQEPEQKSEPKQEAEPEPVTTKDVPAQRTARTTAAARKTTAKKPAKTAAKSRPAKKTAPAQKTAPARKTAPAKTTKATKPAKAKKPAGKAATATTTDGSTATPAADGNGGLTDQVASILARNSDKPLRARDVAKELGRDDSTGAINTVRSTLDRLVATSRARRAGRGLYQAPAA